MHGVQAIEREVTHQCLQVFTDLQSIVLKWYLMRLTARQGQLSRLFANLQELWISGFSCLKHLMPT